MGAPNPFAAFEGRRYLSLETFRKNGQGVRTPVWFAEDSPAPGATSAALVVYTIETTGKVKRIRNNPRVRIAPCDARGRVRGEWVEARAEILAGARAADGLCLLNRKYKPWKQLLDFFARFRPREHVVFALRPAS
ncbi:MAG TPA: PPOX class F420-dependent oxidoreductase [Candidatus Sulfotelmatobacter sp.]|nr:PPOX class F420-dependent oxidoreductase [Candidatus Sulfotelmatobacter sp.]